MPELSFETTLILLVLLIVAAPFIGVGLANLVNKFKEKDN